MNITYRFANALEIKNPESYDFKNMLDLLELIKEKNNEAFDVLNNYITYKETAYNLKNNEDLKSRNMQYWNQLYLKAKDGVNKSGNKLLAFAKDNNINLSRLFE